MAELLDKISRDLLHAQAGQSDVACSGEMESILCSDFSSVIKNAILSSAIPLDQQQEHHGHTEHDDKADAGTQPRALFGSSTRWFSPGANAQKGKAANHHAKVTNDLRLHPLPDQDFSTTWLCQVIVHCEAVSADTQEASCGSLSAKVSRNQPDPDVDSNADSRLRDVGIYLLSDFNSVELSQQTVRGCRQVPFPQFGMQLADVLPCPATDGRGMLQYRQVVASQDEFVIKAVVIHIFSRSILFRDRTRVHREQTQEQDKSQQDVDLGSGRVKRYKRAAKPQTCPASTETRLVLDAITGALNDLKEQTCGVFGINQAESRMCVILPLLAASTANIIRNAWNPHLQPFACEVLECSESDLQDQLHSKLCSAAGAQLYSRAGGTEVPAQELPDVSLPSHVGTAVDMDPGQAEDKLAEDKVQEVVSSQNDEPPGTVINPLNAAPASLDVVPKHGHSMSMDRPSSIPPDLSPSVAWYF